MVLFGEKLVGGEAERMKVNSAILEGLNPKQREAVSFKGAPLLVLAGAGSGKTRVLTSKIAWLVRECAVAPWRILAVTFTNKAAREMKERVETMLGERAKDAQVSTFHSFGLQMLFRNRDALESRGYRRNFVVFDRSECLFLIKKIAKEMGIDPSQADPSWFLDGISRAKTSCDPATLTPVLDGEIAEVFDKYRDSMREQGAFDFDDLITMPLHLMATDSSVLERERARVEWVLVDEYQDVNRPQFSMMKMLAGKSPNIMVVGDPDQSIYGWRGADMSVILGFERHFPGAKVVKLEQNYRSSGVILDAANAVIRNNVNRPDKRLWTDRSGGDLIEVAKLVDERAEARYVADKVEELVSMGYRYSDIAILYRINALSRNFEQEFISRSIPYRVVKGTAFYDRKEVKDVISYLRLAVNHRDGSALARVVNVPPRGIGAKGLSVLSDFLLREPGDSKSVWLKLADGKCPLKGKGALGIKDLACHMLSLLGMGADMGALVPYILDSIGYGLYLEKSYQDQWEERRENVMELTSLNAESDSLEDVLAEISLYTDQEVGGIPEGISLSSLHSAKGLEFPVVFVVGLEEGLFPHSRVIDGSLEEMEEERRLWYVGITRAEERLYVSGVGFRRLFGSVLVNGLSRFLWEIPEACRSMEEVGEEEPQNVRFGFNRRYWGR
ncbi:MAG: UvrD-helicase domain-containing protein [Dethiosulfovibrio sp.]|nr:UvrD-helicase domain-containing protein [Dethiosulfovibrio sp.]